MRISIGQLEPLLANARDFWLGYGSADWCDGDLALYRSGVPDAQLNGVLRLRSAGSAGSGGLDVAASAAAQRLDGVPWLWWAGQDSYPDLAADLLARGATEVETLPVMAVQLDRLSAVDPPPGLAIEKVQGPAALGEWVRCYAPSFGLPPDSTEAMARAEAARLDPPGILVRFAGRMDGHVVGTSALHDRHGVAGVYAVTTARDFRRQGIATALSAAALNLGRQWGLRTATLQATAQGEPVYRRMGFTTVSQYRLFRL
jgi:GNAT superfamily N-acetyltransferase